MPASLKYKKIYFDSKFRSPDSASASDVKFELPETLTFNENTVFYLDDICIPHSWDTIIENINNKLYFKFYTTNAVPIQEIHLIAEIESGSYIGPDLATEIQIRMNNQVRQSNPNYNNVFTCAYIPKTNTISIAVQDIDPHVFAFRILTQPELKTVDWNGPPFDRNKPNDINEIISNLDNFSVRNFSITPFMSGALYLQPFNNIYIHATNLGNYNSIGCQNERTIVKKVPVSADRGMQIFDQCVLMNDYNDCSGQTVKTLFFQLKSSRGDIIPLNGCNWSFSIVFSRNNPDL
jgi:hypothetical protein